MNASEERTTVNDWVWEGRGISYILADGVVPDSCG